MPKAAMKTLHWMKQMKQMQQHRTQGLAKPMLEVGGSSEWCGWPSILPRRMCCVLRGSYEIPIRLKNALEHVRNDRIQSFHF